jgi:hypothetical protein
LALGLLEDAVIPDEKRLLAFRKQFLTAGGGLAPEERRQEIGVPFVRAEQVGKALGAGRGTIGREEPGAELGEQEGTGAMAEAEEHLDRGVEGADEAGVDLVIEGAKQRSEELVQLGTESGRNLGGGEFALGDSGSIIFHGSDLRFGRDGVVTKLYPAEVAPYSCLKIRDDS